MVRLYESKYFHCYNHRWASYDFSARAVIDTDPSKLSVDYAVETQHYVQRDDVEERLDDLSWTFNYLIAWRDITNSTNERTSIFSILPRAGLGNNAGLLVPQEDLEPAQVLALISNLNSLVFITRHVKRLEAHILMASYWNSCQFLARAGTARLACTS
jgi:hypothetical protein